MKHARAEVTEEIINQYFLTVTLDDVSSQNILNFHKTNIIDPYKQIVYIKKGNQYARIMDNS